MNFGLKKQIALGLALTFGISIYSFSQAYNNLQQSVKANHKIKNILQVETRLEQVLLHLKDAEICQRNYLLTRNEKYLGPCNRARDLLEKDFWAISQLGPHSREEHARLNLLRELANRRITLINQDVSEARQTIATQGKFKISTSLRKTPLMNGHGVALMAQITDLVQFMNLSRSRKIQNLSNFTSQKAYNLFYLFLFTGIVASSIFVALLILSYKMGLQTEAQLRVKWLEEQVREKTKALEEQRKEAEDTAKRYWLILEGSNDGIWEWDLKQHWVTTNARYRTLLGLKADIPDQFFFEELLHPDDVTTVRNALKTHMETGEPYKVEIRLKNQETGKYISVLAHGSAFMDAEGRPVRMAGTHTDLTRLKQAEADLRASENKFRRIAESQMIGVLFASVNGVIDEANDYFLNLIGYSRDELKAGEISWQKLTPPDFAALDAFWLSQALAGKRVTAYEKQLIHHDGHYVDVILGFALLEGSKDRGVGFVLDNTQAKKAEQTILDYSEQLKASNQELEHFATIVSHDLQAPLRKILLFAEFLRESAAGQLDPVNLDYINRIHKSAEYLKSFVSDLLDLSRINRRGKPFTPIRFSEVMTLMLENLQPEINEENATVHWEGALTLEADSQQLEMLMRNLVENAIKYHKPGVPPVVDITCVAESPNEVHITVRDNGIGIKPEHHKRIFEIFQRLHGLSEYEGHGIGLAVAQRIVSRHQGKIWVESQLGEGACFHVLLPSHPTYEKPELTTAFA